jgi:hypothetical protein
MKEIVREMDFNTTLREIRGQELRIRQRLSLE